MSDKPNILFLLNDHQAHYRHGWDVGPRPRRPNFDRLAAGGINFTRAYTACPLCMPVRRTMLTGMFPHNHRLLHNSEEQEAAPYELYFSRLAEQGYQNYYYGKWHAGAPGSALDRGCQGFAYPSFGNPYATPEYREYLEQHHLPTAEHLLERCFGPWCERVRCGEVFRAEDGWPDAIGLTITPKETHEAFFLAHLACQQLRACRDRGEPFAMRVDFWGPHHPHHPTREFADLYNPEDIPEYPSFRADLSRKPDIYRTQHMQTMDAGGVSMKPGDLPWSEWQKVIARVYANITMNDAAAGLILDTLESAGLAENTVVVWGTDHGDGLACHGGHFDKGSYMAEEVLRVPLAMRWPGGIRPGQVSHRLVSLLDIGPTFVDLAGTDFPHPTDGTSLLPVCTGDATEWREDLMCETHGYGDDVVGRTVVTDRYKYTATSGQMHELYDLAADPYQLDNRIDAPESVEIREDLQRRLRAWQESTGDPETVLD